MAVRPHKLPHNQSVSVLKLSCMWFVKMTYVGQLKSAVRPPSATRKYIAKNMPKACSLNLIQNFFTLLYLPFLASDFSSETHYLHVDHMRYGTYFVHFPEGLVITILIMIRPDRHSKISQVTKCQDVHFFQAEGFADFFSFSICQESGSMSSTPVSLFKLTDQLKIRGHCICFIHSKPLSLSSFSNLVIQGR